jgi:hypothetical protein
MDKKWVILLLFTANILCNAQTFIGADIIDASIKKNVVCPISSSPEIDGNLDDWKNDRFYNLNHINSYTNGSAFRDLANFSSIYSIKYDKEFLYIAFKIIDDHILDPDNFNLQFDADCDSIKNENSEEGFSCYFFANGNITASNNLILPQITYFSTFNKFDNWIGELKIPLIVFDTQNGVGKKNIIPGDYIQFNIGYEDHDPAIGFHDTFYTCYGLVRLEWGWGTQKYKWWAILNFATEESNDND